MTKLCIIDEKANSQIVEGIEKLGFQILKMPAHPNLAGACQSHPDISLCRIAPNTLVYAKNCDAEFIVTLKKYGLTMIPGETTLQGEYPYDIPYNGVRIGQYFLHNLRYTDMQIKKLCQEAGLTSLQVNQGYTCCSTAVVREDLVITADVGIANVLDATNKVNTLLLPPQKNIRLPGLDYGFLGGATGRIDDTHFVLAGHVNYLENGAEIEEFLQQNGVQLINLTDEKPVDLGTLLFFTL